MASNRYVLRHTGCRELVTFKELEKYEEVIDKINAIPKKNVMYSNIYIINNTEILNYLKQMFFMDLLNGRDLTFKLDKENYLMVCGTTLLRAYTNNKITLKEMGKIQEYIEQNFKEGIDYSTDKYILFKRLRDIQLVNDTFHKCSKNWYPHVIFRVNSLVFEQVYYRFY
jgi:hypothetical protein